MYKIIIICIEIIFISSFLYAQDDYPYPSLSPLGTITQIVGNTTISLEYERPSARKREVFGSLVPWNKVWRTGAGHCTKISFDQSVMIGGQKVEAGKYSLFSIPNPDNWIIILNKDTTLYGSYDYDSKNDVARFTVISQASNRYYETLTIDIDLTPNNARMYISWMNTQVHFDIETKTDADIESYINKNLVTGKSKDPNSYAGAAEYYLYQGAEYFKALKLASKALELDNGKTWASNIKIQIYELLKMYEEAITEMEITIDRIKNPDYGDSQNRDREIKELKKRIEETKSKMK
jgi:hypothetical protein